MADNNAPKINNPKFWLDPNKARFADLYKYVGLDELKMQ